MNTITGWTIIASKEGKGLFSSESQANIAGQEADDPGVILSINGEGDREDGAIYTRSDILSGGNEEDTSRLTPDEQDEVSRLEARDRQVRQHEQSHVAMLGPYARSGPQYVYQVGPDGRLYAVGGSVEADVSDEGDAASNYMKARILQMAALAGGGDASAADMAVADRASALQRKAFEMQA